MLRTFHSVAAWIAALLVLMLALTGVVLAASPLIDRAQARVSGTSALSVAEVVGRIVEHYPTAEQIERTPSGSLIVYFSAAQTSAADRVDPITGQAIAPYQLSPFMVWVKSLHRSLLLDTPGRVVSATAALLMLLLSLSGAVLLLRRLGGWRRLLGPVQGSLGSRIHAELGRFAVLGLILSATTGLYMSATTLGLLPEYQQTDPLFPDSVSIGTPAPVGQLPALQDLPIGALRDLVFPYPGDPADVFSLRTRDGLGFIDQNSGELLSFQSFGPLQRVYEFIYMLHTGEGLWWLALILGLTTLTVPVMTYTGLAIWWRRRAALVTIADNSPAAQADTILLVGSEGNTTWAFAKTLFDALIEAGHRVHIDSMNALADSYPKAKQLFILTSTYGDGAAPSSAQQFLAKLARIPDERSIPVAVLGFGDRQFAQFGAYAIAVKDELDRKGWPALQPLTLVDRQSCQTFSRWGQELSNFLDIPFELAHQPVRLPTSSLQLLSRTLYGEAVDAPIVVLRFGLGKKPKLPSFSAGDLVGIYPPEQTNARFYSLASCSGDGEMEICVRQQGGGICSNYLHSLAVGDSIAAYIQVNGQFRPNSESRPSILIGAGTGIAPLVGFIRHNQRHQLMSLYWGGRHPDSDYLFATELARYLADNRLSRLVTAFSRHADAPGYVQDRILNDGPELRRLVLQGGEFLICGGKAMSVGVQEALNVVLAPLKMSVGLLRSAGRYREDIY